MVSVDGEPVEAGSIVFFRQDVGRVRLVWPPMAPGGEIDGKGRYEIEAIEPGRYVMAVHPDYGARTASAMGENEAGAEEELLEVNMVRVVEIGEGQEVLDVEAGERVLAGRIVDWNGEPVAEGAVYVSPAEAREGWHPLYMSVHSQTDEQGRFAVEHMVDGVYDISVHDAQMGVHLKKGVVVDSEMEELVWELDEVVKVDMDAAELESWERDTIMPYAMVVSRDEPKLMSLRDHGLGVEGFGRAMFRAGEYDVFFMAKRQGYACDGRRVVFEEGMELESPFVESGTVKVVLDGEADEVAGRTVRIRHAGGDELVRLYDPMWSYVPDLCPAVVLPTCSEGVTYISWLEPGEYEVFVEGAGESERIEVEAGEVAEVEMGV
ncbi:hypothetical protein STSP2_01284 [Anaerohalosphaera lusitana]|uniref:Carboxypeptidase regulatory-like domain-containing protein n=1 Tax=Anaerohalosphaera lusitana TaxID=1936003 RepID=A0A1U9NJN2_9BACT|nr:carboxypeptidase-like regulatory domain-containing protein [Anaerohalosphaera lusitana]AQT68129.1 hypothetical protein STSP2_01284 [Anaerohalosphaera lusitana]